MPIDDFLKTYQNSLFNKKIINPLTTRNTPVAESPQFGIEQGKVQTPQSPTFGQNVPDWLQGKTTGALDRYMQNKGDRTSELASKYTDMASGQISVDKYGIPTDKMTNFTDYFNKNLQTTDDIGKAALAGEEAKARWQTLQNQAELNAGYSINYTPGASGNSVGARAVSIAMQAKGTPYVWGGNSLTNGVDCSGLVQQVYKKLGINLPRTTYEQAKSGKIVSIGSLLPGDLVFYNTGSRDPNGIGNLSHVAIYIGNGQVIDAPGSGRSVRVTTLNNSGTPARAVRPW
jgi:cell wall-associated NlpC family hydrolase